MAKLLTNHDPGHIHAMCGLLALVHYLYRFWLVICDVPDAGFGTTPNHLWQDVACMTIMALPNATSFLFTIVRAKKGLDGFTIWKEYRWHAFVFAFKLWLVMAMLLYRKHFVLPTPNSDQQQQQQHGVWKYEVYYRAAFEFATMWAAHYVTSLYPPQVSTIRGMYTNPSLVFFAGFMQFLGRASIFCGTPDPRDDINVLILAIFIIQLNAFNMTLRKKRITGPQTTQAFYSIMLGSALYLFLVRRFLEFPPTGLFDRKLKAVSLAAVAYYCRLQGCDRFSSWIIALCAIAVASQQFGLFEERPPELIA